MMKKILITKIFTIVFCLSCAHNNAISNTLNGDSNKGPTALSEIRLLFKFKEDENSKKQIKYSYSIIEEDTLTRTRDCISKNYLEILTDESEVIVFLPKGSRKYCLAIEIEKWRVAPYWKFTRSKIDISFTYLEKDFDYKKSVPEQCKVDEVSSDNKKYKCPFLNINSNNTLIIRDYESRPDIFRSLPVWYSTIAIGIGSMPYLAIFPPLFFGFYVENVNYEFNVVNE